MPGLDGLGVIARLRERSVPLPQFVLATAYDQYAVEAFRLEAADYLLKPVEKERLAQTLERARKSLAERARTAPAEVPPPRPARIRTKLLVRKEGRNLIVDARELVYAKIDEGEITLVTTSLEGACAYKTIDELESNLDPEMFWRVHRSWLVNINRIKEVIPWFKSSFQLRMDDRRHTEIHVSRSQTRRLRALFKL